MPAARNQREAVRRRSVVNRKPTKRKENSGRRRASRSRASRPRAVDKGAGIVHDGIAGPPWGGRVATTSWQGGLALRYPNFTTPNITIFPESAVRSEGGWA